MKWVSAFSLDLDLIWMKGVDFCLYSFNFLVGFFFFLTEMGWWIELNWVSLIRVRSTIRDVYGVIRIH